MTSTDLTTHPVDQRLPAARTALLGLQHVLVMYSACIVVPLILGAALRLPRDQIVLLINADLFAAGLASLVQALGFWKFGIRMPVMMGVTAFLEFNRDGSPQEQVFERARLSVCLSLSLSLCP